jgi:hypothetical protein
MLICYSDICGWGAGGGGLQELTRQMHIENLVVFVSSPDIDQSLYSETPRDFGTAVPQNTLTPMCIFRQKCQNLNIKCRTELGAVFLEFRVPVDW